MIDEAVLPGLRVVVVAEQQRLIDERADLAFRRFDQRQPQVARRELDAVEVARDVARRA